jgi:hypothetical protein
MIMGPLVIPNELVSQIGTKEKAPESNDSEALVATLPCPHCTKLVAVYMRQDKPAADPSPTPEGPPDLL